MVMVGTAPRWAHHEGQPSYYRMTRDEACPSMFYTCADVYVGAELPGHDQKWRVEGEENPWMTKGHLQNWSHSNLH